MKLNWNVVYTLGHQVHINQPELVMLQFNILLTTYTPSAYLWFDNFKPVGGETMYVRYSLIGLIQYKTVWSV